MNRTILAATALTAACLLCAGKAQAQAPAETVSQEMPRGFMIEGVLAQQLFSIGYMTQLTYPAAAGVPHAIIGYRARRLAFGLGFGFYRFGVRDKTGDEKSKDILTSMLFSPRFEITLYRSRRGIAEAYLALSIGAGFFHHVGESSVTGDEETEVDALIGGHAGLGARVFLGGSPFALGGEFGWTGMFMHLGEDFTGPDSEQWMNTSGLYAALTICFVFD